MHFHLPFNAQDILWTLAFAAQLVLLVVLMGRERIGRFPWFTAAAVMLGLRLLTAKLLSGRLPQLTMAALFIIMAEISALIGLLVVLEIARRAFDTVRRATWVAWAFILLAVGAAALTFWGPWPAWKTLTAHSTVATLQLLQLMAQKTSMLVDIENIAVGLLVVLFGRRYGAGWRSHTQQIAIGLSASSLAQLAIGVLWERIARTAVVQTMADQQRILAIRDELFNANSAIYIVVVLWWIVWLWKDEPGQPATAVDQAKAQDEQVIAASQSAESPEAKPQLDA
jgi:hypothetical protein